MGHVIKEGDAAYAAKREQVEAVLKIIIAGESLAKEQGIPYDAVCVGHLIYLANHAAHGTDPDKAAEEMKVGFDFFYQQVKSGEVNIGG